MQTKWKAWIRREAGKKTKEQKQQFILLTTNYDYEHGKRNDV